MINPRPPYSNELYHYGVKGMKWGVRRYQPYPKGYHGKGRYIGSMNSNTKRLTSAEKEHLLRYGTPKQVYNYRHQLTVDEMGQAARRIQQEQTLANLRWNTPKMQAYENIGKKFETTTKLAKNALSLGNTIRLAPTLFGRGPLQYTPAEARAVERERMAMEEARKRAEKDAHVGGITYKRRRRR